MTTDEHVPSDEQVRGRYCDGTYVQTGHTTEGEGFDAWFARVRRDAAREALDGLAREAAGVAEASNEHTNPWVSRVVQGWAEEYRDTHYPEETP